MFRRWLQNRCDARVRVERDAGDLLTFMGEPGYGEARARARACRKRGDAAGDRHWGRVSVAIADRIGHRIGVSTADRFLEDEPPPSLPNRKAIIDELVEIAEGIRDLTRSPVQPTALHNAQAAVHRLVSFDGSDAAEAAGQELRAALARLAAEPVTSVAAVGGGRYPPMADAAGTALARLREIMLPRR